MAASGPRAEDAAAARTPKSCIAHTFASTSLSPQRRRQLSAAHRATRPGHRRAPSARHRVPLLRLSSACSPRRHRLVGVGVATPPSSATFARRPFCSRRRPPAARRPQRLRRRARVRGDERTVHVAAPRSAAAQRGVRRAGRCRRWARSATSGGFGRTPAPPSRADGSTEGARRARAPGSAATWQPRPPRPRRAAGDRRLNGGASSPTATARSHAPSHEEDGSATPSRAASAADSCRHISTRGECTCAARNARSVRRPSGERRFVATDSIVSSCARSVVAGVVFAMPSTNL